MASSVIVGLASAAAGAYGAHKKVESAKAARDAAAGAAYEPPVSSYKDQGYEERRGKQNKLYDKVGSGSEFRGDQRGLVDMLKERAEGGGNSLAQNTLQAGIENAQSAALGSASARPGAAGGLGLRNILGAQGNLALQGANQSAQLGLREQAQATSQLGQAANQGRQGDYRDNQQMLDILKTQGVEDHRNRAAMAERERLIGTGRRHAATGVANANTRIGNAEGGMWDGIANYGGKLLDSGLTDKWDKGISGWLNDDSQPYTDIGTYGQNTNINKYGLGTYNPNTGSGGF